MRISDWSSDVCSSDLIGFVAYAPLSRGLLTGRYKAQSDLAESDRRNDMPRFKSGTIDRNVARMAPLVEIAAAHGCSQAAVALAWLLAQGDDVVPLPGCSRRTTLQDSLSALDVALTAEELANLSKAFRPGAIEGTRYPEKQMSRLGLKVAVASRRQLISFDFRSEEHTS